MGHRGKRSQQATLTRQLKKSVADINHLLLNHAFWDRNLAEVVNLTDREELVSLLKVEGVWDSSQSLVPSELLRGEILIDSRKRGSMANYGLEALWDQFRTEEADKIEDKFESEDKLP